VQIHLDGLKGATADRSTGKRDLAGVLVKPKAAFQHLRLTTAPGAELRLPEDLCKFLAPLLAVDLVRVRARLAIVLSCAFNSRAELTAI
jgi:hypothetical protein